ncbi:MAG: hypothetical protein D6718_01830, partial [Acidobacteria bacterium]
RSVPGGVAWRFDRAVVEALLEDDRRGDFWPVVEDPPPGVELQLVRAGRSAFWTEACVERLARAARHPRVSVTVIAEAGHWLHVDAPEALAELLERALLENRSRRAAPGSDRDQEEPR